MGAEADTSKVGAAASGDETANVDGTEVDAGNGTGTGANGTDAKGTAQDGTDDGLKKALAAERQRANKAEKALRDAELAKLPEMDRLKSENETLTTENEKLSKENTRMKIALDLKLPWSLAKRIQGDNEDEMRDDAADILKNYKTDSEDPKDKKRPPNDASKSGSGGSEKIDMNRLLRAASGRQGK